MGELGNTLCKATWCKEIEKPCFYVFYSWKGFVFRERRVKSLKHSFPTRCIKMILWCYLHYHTANIACCRSFMICCSSLWERHFVEMGNITAHSMQFSHRWIVLSIPFKHHLNVKHQPPVSQCGLNSLFPILMSIGRDQYDVRKTDRLG